MRVGGSLLLLALGACGPLAPFQARFAARGRWQGERVIAYQLEPAGGALAPAQFARAIRSALAQWTATGCATFRAALPAEPPALVFAWARDEHARCAPFGTGPSVAHAGPVGPGTFVHFDAGREWDARALEQAALHEIGHVLGLDHSPDEQAVMYPEPSPARAHLGPSDLAGIHSLYGGGAATRGDLALAGASSALVLHSVAPAELTDWTLFDTDGDGDDEVLVWRTDAAGHGALWSHHFAPGPRLERTLGPLYGLAARGLTLDFRATPDGARLLLARDAHGALRAHAFDPHGVPMAHTGALPPCAGPPSRSRVGDLDGDGRRETVVRRD